MKKTIGELYGYSKDDKNLRTGVVDHFNKILGKTPDGLDDDDISFLLRQEKLLDLAIPRAIERLADNPYCGHYYEGEMIYSLSRVKDIPVKYLPEIKSLLPKLEAFAESYSFELDGDKGDYLDCLNEIKGNLTSVC